MTGVADVTQGEPALSQLRHENFDATSMCCNGRFAEMLIVRQKGVGNEAFLHIVTWEGGISSPCIFKTLGFKTERS
jgi:hypothetical protein